MMSLVLVAAMLVAFAVFVASMVTTIGGYIPAMNNSTLVQMGNVTIGADGVDSEEIAIAAPSSGNATYGVYVCVQTTYTAGAAQALVAGALHLDTAIQKTEFKAGGETSVVQNSVLNRWIMIIQQAFNKTAIAQGALAAFGGAGAAVVATRCFMPYKTLTNSSIKFTSGPVTNAFLANVTQNTVYTVSAIYGEDDGRSEWLIETTTLPAINGTATFQDKLKECSCDLLMFANATDANFLNLLVTSSDSRVVINSLGGDLQEKATQCGLGLARVANSLVMPLGGPVPLGLKAYMSITTNAALTIGLGYTRLKGGRVGSPTGYINPSVGPGPTTYSPSTKVAVKPNPRVVF